MSLLFMYIYCNLTQYTCILKKKERKTDGISAGVINEINDEKYVIVFHLKMTKKGTVLITPDPKETRKFTRIRLLLIKP